MALPKNGAAVAAILGGSNFGTGSFQIPDTARLDGDWNDGNFADFILGADPSKNKMKVGTLIELNETGADDPAGVFYGWDGAGNPIVKVYQNNSEKNALRNLAPDGRVTFGRDRGVAIGAGPGQAVGGAGEVLSPEEKEKREQAKLTAEVRGAIGLKEGETPEQYAARYRAEKLEPALKGLIDDFTRLQMEQTEKERRDAAATAGRMGGAAEAPIAQAGVQGLLAAASQAGQGRIETMKKQSAAQIASQERAIQDAATQALMNISTMGKAGAMDAFWKQIALDKEAEAKMKNALAEAESSPGFVAQFGGPLGSLLGLIGGGIAAAATGGLAAPAIAGMLAAGSGVGGILGGTAQTIAGGQGTPYIERGASGLYDYLTNMPKQSSGVQPISYNTAPPGMGNPEDEYLKYMKAQGMD